MKITVVLLAIFVISAVTWKVYDYQTNKKNYSRGINEKEIANLDKIFVSSDKDISEFQDQLTAGSDNPKLLTKLGVAYLLKARETSDPEYYSLAEDVLKRTVNKDPENYLGIAALGMVYNSRYKFKEALVFAESALSVNPYSPYAFGVLSDAQTGLGMYDEALKSIDRIKDTKSDLIYYSRVSRMLELKGDTQGAIDAMKSAIIVGSPIAEITAYCRAQMGRLFYDKGDIETAEQIYSFLIRDFEEYSHGYGGMAKVKFNRKQYDEAIELYKKALEKNPFPEYMIALGDVYVVKGEKEKAEEQYQKVNSVIEMYREKGVDTDREFALFHADHDQDLQRILITAEESLLKENGSKSINVYHVIARINYRLGKYEEAEKNMEQALRLGTRDPLMYYHAGKIYEKLGNETESRKYLDFALMVNPFYEKLYSD
jgi:tetratricopeptide (TPR) repeat protein